MEVLQCLTFFQLPIMDDARVFCRSALPNDSLKLTRRSPRLYRGGCAESGAVTGPSQAKPPGGSRLPLARPTQNHTFQNQRNCVIIGMEVNDDSARDFGRHSRARRRNVGL